MPDRETIRKEMTEAEWNDLEIRRLDVEITELLVSFGSLVRWMEESGQVVPSVPSLAIMKSEETRTLTVKEEETVELETELPGRGRRFPVVAFVGASMSSLDKIRNRHLSGMVGKTFNELYVEPLGLTQDDIYVTTIVKDVVIDPETGNSTDPSNEQIRDSWEEFTTEMDSVQPRFIVALGKTAASYLADSAEWAPHPRAIRLMGDSGEVARKMARLKKAIETPSETISGEIIKSVDEKQIVYGIVMEPYTNDTDENWTSENEIEDAAHSFMKNFRLIDTQHSRVDINAVPVESWLQHEDTVINGQPVKAGSWVMGVKVDDPAEWEKVKSGEYSGFSIDAFAHIAPSLRLPNG